MHLASSNIYKQKQDFVVSDETGRKGDPSIVYTHLLLQGQWGCPKAIRGGVNSGKVASPSQSSTETHTL